MGLSNNSMVENLLPKINKMCKDQPRWVLGYVTSKDGKRYEVEHLESMMISGDNLPPATMKT